MPRNLFIFGRNPVLSLAELSALLEYNPTVRSLERWNNALLLENETEQAPFEIDQLGGTTKIARIIGESTDVETLFSQPAVTMHLKRLPERFLYALSFVGNIPAVKEQVIVDTLRDYFRTQRYKAQYKKGTQHKQQNQRITNPSEILSWNLLKTQTDFIVAHSAQRYYLGFTESVTLVGEWKKRDEQRPQKDNKEIVSIRLAKLLINFTGVHKGQTILDPFCGYGTILQEANVVGIRAIGIEKDAEKAHAAEQNLRWIQKEYTAAATSTVLTGNATELSRLLAGKTIHAVATEPYLGPYLKSRPTPARARQIITELIPLYDALFEELGKLLIVGTRVAILLPVFEIGREKYAIPPRVFQRHFKVSALFEHWPEIKVRFPIFYQNPGNKIGRELWVLTKQ